MVTADYLESMVEKWGEVFVVLESDREYVIHGTDGYTRENDSFEVEGFRDGEWLVVQFEADAIEHIYTHKEV